MSEPGLRSSPSSGLGTPSSGPRHLRSSFYAAGFGRPWTWPFFPAETSHQHATLPRITSQLPIAFLICQHIYLHLRIRGSVAQW